MEGLVLWPYFSLGITVVSSAVLLWLQIRQNKDKLSADTLQKYEKALEIRETTISDLEAARKKDRTEYEEKMAAQALAHAEQMKGVQAQITGLQAQITALTTKNKVLEDSVTGKVYLEQILTMLTMFQPLIAKDGILEEFKSDHAKANTALEDIKNKLGIINRHEDSNGTTPPGN